MMHWYIMMTMETGEIIAYDAPSFSSYDDAAAYIEAHNLEDQHPECRFSVEYDPPAISYE